MIEVSEAKKTCVDALMEMADRIDESTCPVGCTVLIYNSDGSILRSFQYTQGLNTILVLGALEYEKQRVYELTKD